MSNRVNVTFDQERYNDLSALAKYRKISLSEIVRQCVEDKLEDLEDRYLSKLADERIAESEDEDYISHEEFWARVLQD